MYISTSVIASLFIGAIAGWIAGMLMNSRGSLLRNIILGVVGGAVGNYLFDLIGFHAYKGFGNIITAVVGSCVIIYVGRKLCN